MQLKENLNHREYIKILRKMTPEQRLLKSFELTEFANQLFLTGLRNRFPEFSEKRIREIYIEGLNKCHNRDY